MSYRQFFFIIAVPLMLSACASQPDRRDDPLIEKIYRARDQQQIDRAQLLAQIAEARVIYLGETHDNPRHHQLQLEILQEQLDQGRRPALGFEFFSLEQTPYLMQYAQTEFGKTAGRKKKRALKRLRKQLGWESRDEEWGFYSPLLKLANQYQLPVFGADLAPGMIKRLTKVGAAGLSSLESRLLFPSDFKNPDYRQMMYTQFTQSHCGWSQPQLLERLYDTWIARNDAMAMSIASFLEERPTEPVVMILGSGHIANNMAVYERVAARIPGIRQVNLGFRQVARTPRPASDYLQPVVVNDTRFAPDHEYFWFTQRVSYIDPCEQFKKQLKKPPG